LLPHEALDGSANEVVGHLRVSKKPLPGGRLHFSGGLDGGGFDATYLGRWPDAQGQLFRLRLSGPPGDTPYDLMARHGHVPLPPYITHADDADDERRYQTVFARVPGAVAAPTAALHFDEAVLSELDARGVNRASVTLHVGAGTFAPMKTERIEEHVMHHERYAIPPQTLQAIADCRTRGGHVVAVGTTTVRTLESWARSGDTSGDTNIFITPGFEFRVVDLLITNFHLPKSTLMMLVSAFAGHERVMALYAHAVSQRYRFFSYGDSMLLKRTSGA
jgi:S-adenosylmethionine:tRNA ribosyltransferase-isomerase